jgi:hypothetical protein
MAKLFGKRTDNDIKNKWYSMARKKRRVGQRSDVLAVYNHQNSLLQMQRNAVMFPWIANVGHLAPYAEAEMKTTDNGTTQYFATRTGSELKNPFFEQV